MFQNTDAGCAGEVMLFDDILQRLAAFRSSAAMERTSSEFGNGGFVAANLGDTDAVGLKAHGHQTLRVWRSFE